MKPPTSYLYSLLKNKTNSLKIIVRNGNLEQAMRVLKKKLQKDGRLRELKERQYYTKPSELKREAKKRGIINTKKRMKKLALQRGF